MMDEETHNQARAAMVKTQMEGRGIRNPKVLQAFREIPRHRFVPERHRDHAYEDNPLSIGLQQTISQPYTVAFMTEALMTPEPGETVLEIGTGSGYQTAILCKLYQHVYSVERHEKLARQAENVLHDLGLDNASLRVGDGTRGWADHAPYDAIIVTAGAPVVPGPLIEQLAEGGRLIIPVGKEGFQEMLLITKTTAGVDEKSLGAFSFVPLVGELGWQKGREA